MPWIPDRVGFSPLILFLVPATSVHAIVNAKHDSVAGLTSATAVNETLYAFIHIPKCAGTSFLNCFKSSLRPESSLLHPYSDVGAAAILSKIFPRKGSSYNARGCGPQSFGGTHCSVGEIRDCFASGDADMAGTFYDPNRTTTRYFTILRHPVPRVLSEFYWWRGLLNVHAWPAELVTEGVNAVKMESFDWAEGVLKWVRSPYNVAHNRMVKQLTGTGQLMPNRRFRNGVDCASFDMDYYQQYWTSRYNATWTTGLEARINEDASLVDEAERNLLFAGTQEDLMGSASRLLELLHVDGAPSEELCQARSHVSNRAQARAPGLPGGRVPEDIVQEIERRNALDLALYRQHAASAPRALRLGGLDAGHPWTWEEVLQDGLD